MEIKNRVFIVTGGGNGMGREITLNLVNKGAKVAAIDINEAGLNETVELAGEFGANISTHIVNIADIEAVEAFSADVLKVHGTVDGVINNAGIIQPFLKAQELDYTTIERVMNVNFYGTLYLTKTFLPLLMERPEASIVNISSMGGYLPVPGQSIYGAAKAGVKLFTESLQSELKGSNVHVTVIFPGAIATNIKANSGLKEDAPKEEKKKKVPIEPLAPSAAAEMIVGAIENNQSRLFVGKDSWLMDKLYRISPKFAANLIYKQMGDKINH